MEGMPPVHLGATILTLLGLALALRVPLGKALVDSAPMESRSGRRFFLEMALCVFAGTGAMAWAVGVWANPFESSAYFSFGFVVAGFFISLDMALAEERKVIALALQTGRVVPPGRLSPMTRKFTLVAMASTFLVCGVILLVVMRDLGWLAEAGTTQAALDTARRSAMVEILFIMAVLMGLLANTIVSYSKNLKLLFENETQVLNRVSDGDLSSLVPVATQDEFGAIAGHTNTMIQGLRERTQMLAELELAEEVQKNLLPQAPPGVPGLDLAGTSIYCSQTGGDYFDFLDLGEDRLGLVVADAADHGVGAALHMATARAIFRSQVAQGIDPCRVVTETNRLLTVDSGATGRFMTLFYLVVDMAEKSLTWVRAGQDPAAVFDPKTQEIRLLEGKGPAMGFSQEVEYEQYGEAGLEPGQVIVLFTDGVWETQDPEGEMMGKPALYEIICQNHAKSAREIVEAVVRAGEEHRQGGEPEDDVTLLVVKIQ